MFIFRPFLALTMLAAITSGISPQNAFSHETVGEKIETGVDGAKKDMRQSGRRAKRKARNATGRGSVIKDTGDAMKSAGEDIEHEAKKAGRKID